MINIILRNIRKCKFHNQYTNGLFYDEFIEDEIVIDASMFRLVKIVENIKGLSDEYKKSHAFIPWGLIIGFRNGIVQDYGKTDYSIVYEIIKNDIHDLKEKLDKNLTCY